MFARTSLSLLVFGSLALAMGCGSSTSSGLARTGSGSSGGDGSSDSDGGLAIGTDPSLDDGGTDPVGGVASCAQAAAAHFQVN